MLYTLESKEKLRWLSEDWKQISQYTWLLSMQFSRKLLDKICSGSDCAEKKWYEFYQADLVAVAKLLCKWSKNVGNNRVARDLKAKLIIRQNCQCLHVIFATKIIARDFLDGLLPNSINKFITLHWITGQIEIKAQCSRLLSRSWGAKEIGRPENLTCFIFSK